MDRLVLKNTGIEYEYINDLGIGVAPGEDLDLIPNYRDEDLLESLDLESALAGNLEVWLNNSVQMSYQDVIDYLTKLTRYDVIDFDYISSEDANTDVTGTELEQLTDGSDTALHTHDTRYYTKTNLSTPGQSSVDWANIVNAPGSSNLTIQNGQVYVYDSTRNKTLSAYEQNYSFSSNAANGRFLNVGTGFGFDIGYVVPYNATITRFTISASGGWSGKIIEMRKNNTTVLHAHTMTASIETINTLDVDVNPGDLLQVFVQAGGPAIRRVSCGIYIRERI